MDSDRKFHNLFANKAKDIAHKKKLEHMAVNVFKNERLSLGTTVVAQMFAKEYGEEAKKWDAKVIKVGFEKKEDEIKPDKKQFDTKFLLFNQLPEHVNVMQMAMGKENTFALTVTGKVYSWGSPHSALGRKVKTGDKTGSKPEHIIELVDIIQIAVGDHHGLALDVYGQVWSWGSNEYGQCGHGQLHDEYIVPEIISDLDDTVAQIYAGPNTSIAVTKSGLIKMWGQNKYGQITDDKDEKIWYPTELKKVPFIAMEETDISLFLGKSNAGYLFSTAALNKMRFSKTGNPLEIKRLQTEKQTIDERFNALQAQYQKLQGLITGNNEIRPKVQASFDKDSIINQLTDELRSLERQIRINEERIKQSEGESKSITSDIEAIKKQLREVEEKEDELREEINKYDGLIQAQVKTGRERKELERSKKTSEELAKSNEQIKNMIQSKQLEKEDRIGLLTAEQRNLTEELKRIFAKKNMIEFLISERKETLATRLVNDDKEAVTSYIQKFYDYFLTFKEFVVEKIDNPITGEKGLQDMIESANDSIMNMKKTIDAMNLRPDNALYKSVSMLMEIVQDCLDMRLQINDYIQCFLNQSEMKIEEITIKEALDQAKINIGFEIAREAIVNKFKSKYPTQRAEISNKGPFGSSDRFTLQGGRTSTMGMTTPQMRPTSMGTSQTRATTTQNNRPTALQMGTPQMRPTSSNKSKA